MNNYLSAIVFTGFLLTAEMPLMASLNSNLSTENGKNIVSISYVEPVHIDVPVSTVPRLPYRLWVKYSDGQSEYRQVKWNNYLIETEKKEADSSLNPVGSKYSVSGFILGDDATENGYPVKAEIEVVDGRYITPSNKPVATPACLKSVMIEGDNRLSSNRNLAIKEIVSWDVTQYLYNYRDTYGLSTEGYTRPVGWDSPDIKLKGHGSGHYMSALALAYTAVTDPVEKAILKKNMTRMVNELRQYQEMTFVWCKDKGRYFEARDFAPEEELKNMKGTWTDFDRYKKECKKYGYGYINAIPAQHPALIEMYRAYNNSDWVWAPYYTIHKQLAGLIDIATYIDDKAVADKALLVAKDMGLWVWNRLHYRTYVKTDGTQDERRAKPGNRYEMWNMYIAGEVGGMSESLARLSEMVSNPTEKEHLKEAFTYFDSPAFYEPLSKNIDDIRGRHANQHIPMIVGAVRGFMSLNEPYYYNIAENFWNLVQGRYRYATGGVGNGEMFRQPYTQILSMVMNGVSEGDSHSNPDINETCCVYNLLKLTKDLNSFNPDDARYMDYYERTLYNQIIGSLNPEHYLTTYQYAVGMNASKPWGNENPQSTCCGGTGSENHVKYQEATYFTSDNTMWVALYMPTSFDWEKKGVIVEQVCTWPSEKSVIKIKSGKADFTMKLRVPYWATESFTVKINGKLADIKCQPGTYAVIPNRTWSSGDEVEVMMPFTKHIDFAPDKLSGEILGKGNSADESSWVGTLMYGPFAMTATDISDWKDASMDIDMHLTSVTVNKPTGVTTGTEGNLYTLKQNNREFQPDYYRHDHSTHYFKINYLKDPTVGLKQALSLKLDETKAFDKANYTKRSYINLEKAKRTIEKLIKEESISEAEVSMTIGNLQNSIENLDSKSLNRGNLIATLDEVKNIDAGLYTTDSFERLKKESDVLRHSVSSLNKQYLIDKKNFELKNIINSLVKIESVDKSYLISLINMANERKKSQESWTNQTIKTQASAPWAKFGYMRLMYVLKEAEDIYSNNGKNYSQSDVNSISSNLNSAINTMRPGNLPEQEDLRTLFALLRRVGDINESSSAELKEAVEYTNMVIKYVEDGSGTRDMIDHAENRMKKFASK